MAARPDAGAPANPCLDVGKARGAQAASSAFFGVGGCVLAAHKFSPTFRTRLGVSGKTALVVMATMGVFVAVYETEATRCQRQRAIAEQEARRARQEE